MMWQQGRSNSSFGRWNRLFQGPDLPHHGLTVLVFQGSSGSQHSTGDPGDDLELEIICGWPGENCQSPLRSSLLQQMELYTTEPVSELRSAYLRLTNQSLWPKAFEKPVPSETTHCIFVTELIRFETRRASNVTLLMGWLVKDSSE